MVSNTNLSTINLMLTNLDSFQRGEELYFFFNSLKEDEKYKIRVAAMMTNPSRCCIDKKDTFQRKIPELKIRKAYKIKSILKKKFRKIEISILGNPSLKVHLLKKINPYKRIKQNHRPNTWM